MNNLNISVSKNQEKNIYADLTIKSVKQHLLYLNSKHTSVVEIFNKIIFFTNCFGSFTFPSQTLLARKTVYSRSWVNKQCKYLRDLNWIQMDYRHRRTCLYFINPFFKKKRSRWFLRHLLPNLKWQYRKRGRNAIS